MKQYNFNEAKKNFALIFEIAKQEGIICISKKNGESFYLTSKKANKLPLDVDGINLNLSSEKIVSIVRKGRERNL